MLRGAILEIMGEAERAEARGDQVGSGTHSPKGNANSLGNGTGDSTPEGTRRDCLAAVDAERTVQPRARRGHRSWRVCPTPEAQDLLRFRDEPSLAPTQPGRLPVMDEVKREARRRHVKLIILPTAEAIAKLQEGPARVNAVLHITCWLP